MFSQFDWLEALRSSPIMVGLLVCSIFSLGAAIDRVLHYRRRRGNPDLLLAQTIDLVRRGKVEDAMANCKKNNHPFGAVAARVLESLRHARGSSEEYLQIALSEEKLLLERNLSVLGSMAAIAPLIGLLGTVVGIMRAFHDMSITGSAAPSVVAAGVAEALLTTAAGLVVAVPSVLLYNHFNRRMTVILTVSENHARSLRAVYLESKQISPDQESGPISKSILLQVNDMSSQPEYISS